MNHQQIQPVFCLSPGHRRNTIGRSTRSISRACFLSAGVKQSSTVPKIGVSRPRTIQWRSEDIKAHWIFEQIWNVVNEESSFWSNAKRTTPTLLTGYFSRRIGDLRQRFSFLILKLRTP